MANDQPIFDFEWNMNLNPMPFSGPQLIASGVAEAGWRTSGPWHKGDSNLWYPESLASYETLRGNPYDPVLSQETSHEAPEAAASGHAATAASLATATLVATNQHYCPVCFRA